MIIVSGFLELQFKTFMVWERVGIPSRKTKSSVEKSFTSSKLGRILNDSLSYFKSMLFLKQTSLVSITVSSLEALLLKGASASYCPTSMLRTLIHVGTGKTFSAGAAS